MKKLKLLLILLIAILFLSSCDSRFVEFPFDENFKDWSGLSPVITDFDGELFGDKNITVDGLYTGCEKLGDIMHCNDDGLTIWFDKYNGSLYKLNYNGQKEKICPHEDCRNDIDGSCNHMQIHNYIYSDGFLYFTYGGYDTVEVEVSYWYNKTENVEKIVSEGVFIYRYDIEKYEYEKLMEFQGVTSCEIALNGRYLYAQTYTWEYDRDQVSGKLVKAYKADFSITRIDLFQENAVVVYSDLMNREDFKKLCDPINFSFINDKIIMPVNGIKAQINICNLDMMHIITLIEFENETIRELYLYENDIYFITGKWTGEDENIRFEQQLCRVSIDMYNLYLKEAVLNTQSDEKIVLLDSKKREILKTDINSFCIDENFLYYKINGDTSLYRIKLDYSRNLDFYNKFKVYIPEQGEHFDYFGWKVCGGYLYAALIREDDWENSGWRCRIKLNSETDTPYLFYKEY